MPERSGCKSLCFARSLALTKRPRPQQLCNVSKFKGQPLSVSAIRLEQKTQAPSDRYSSPRIILQGSQSAALKNSKESHNASSILPDGPFTMLLRIKIRPQVRTSDAKVVLSEYARKSCAEPGVLRCDVLYEVTSRGARRDNFYEIWIYFENSRAYTDHERTPHASKLRIWLQNPSGGDNAVLLLRLSYSSSILKLVRPAISGWTSPINYSVEGKSGLSGLTAGIGAIKAVGEAQSEEASDSLRKSLDVLISNVGLENVTILVSRATASSSTVFESFKQICDEYVANLQTTAGIIRAGLFSERNNPLSLVIIQVHDSNNEEGAYFELELAEDVIDDDGWDVKRCFAVFPDKIGWENPTDELPQLGHQEEPEFGQGMKAKDVSFLGPLETDPDAMKKAMATNQSDSKYRLVQGVGAFDEIQRLLREKAGMKVGQLKVMIISGWNSSRIHSLLIQIETAKDDQQNAILFKHDLNVLACNASSAKLKKGLALVREYQPDVIIGYGGGAVMDMTKAVGKFANCVEEDVENIVAAIDNTANSGGSKILFDMKTPALPVLLIPSNVSSGSEFTEFCIIAGKCDDGRKSRRISIDFQYPPEATREWNEKTVVVDSRTIAPTRLQGWHAAQGTLMNVCQGMDILITAYDATDHPSVRLAFEAITESSDMVLPALREPYHADGSTRDPIAYAKTKIGVATDAIGRIGICTRLALGIVDELVDGPTPCCFRIVLVRVTAALIKELCEMNGNVALDLFFVELRQAYKVKTNEAVVVRLLARAEDCGMDTLREMGFVRRCIPALAERMANYMQQEKCGQIESLFKDRALIERVLIRAAEQDYEL